MTATETRENITTLNGSIGDTVMKLEELDGDRGPENTVVVQNPRAQ